MMAHFETIFLTKKATNQVLLLQPRTTIFFFKRNKYMILYDLN
jgi:hypothetical protein